MKPIRLLGMTAALLLVAGSAGAQITFFTNGVVRHQFWSGPNRQQVEQGQAGQPTFDDFSSASIPVINAQTAAPTSADFFLNVFDTPEEEGDNYVDRVTTLFIPAVTGNYVFFLSSDDDSDLFLSTDATPANKKLIAQEASWANTDQWTANDAVQGIASQKRSDQWTNGTGVAPYKNGIPLVAGQKYWLEAVHHEGGGGDQVGATFKLTTEADPANGTPSALTGSVIGYGLTISSPITVATQVKNVTTEVGVAGTFTFVPNNPTSDPLVNNALTFQWYRNNAIIPNATGESYTIVPTAADSGAQFTCVASLDPIYNASLSVTSAVGTLTVNSTSVTYTNGLKRARYFGATLASLEAGSTGPAGNVNVTSTGFESTINDGVNNYAERLSGWFIPPTSGNYVFFLSSDDDADLFLSTDATAANKRIIAQESNWSPSRQWVGNTNTDTTSPGGSLLSQKRSDQWTNSSGTAPFATGIALTAGTPYYIEADHHQGGGGDNVAVLAQLVGPDPTNGAPPIPNSELSLITSATTSLSFTNQPKSLTVFEGATAIFSGGATSDSEFTVLYQWQRNGTNIPGATASTYSLTTIAADTGSTFDLVASTQEGGLVQTSSVVTLTVQQAVFEPGLALVEHWLNKGADLTVPEGGGFGPPDFQFAVPAFEAGVNNENGDTYVNKVSGFFVPPTTGAYDFITTGDDHNDFFMSTDSNPNNKRLICQQVGWANALTWSSDQGGGADMNQKHSVTWTNASGVAPYANGIQLTAGNKYYIEVWHQEGGGGDSVAVTAIKHGDPNPTDGTDSSIAGNMLGFNAPNTAHFVAFTNQPTSQSVLSGSTATFTAGGESDGNLPIGTTGKYNNVADGSTAANFVQFPNVLFQWYKNGVAIPGAIQPTYTTPPLKPADGAQYYVGIRALGMATWSNSTTVTLTVIADTNKPTVYSSVFDENGLPVVSVSFSKVMDLSTITNQANYSLSGGGASIVGIIVDTNDARHVTLQLAAEPTGPITLTLTGILDFSGNSPVSSTVSVATNPLTNADIGDPTANPPDPDFPGSMWLDGAGAYTIRTEGSDIWNAADGFNFSYESKTNDFDVVVRQISFTKVSNWSKGGLMVREDLTAASRNWNIVNDPTSADGINAIDGSGTGANAVECNARPSPGAASGGWATGPGTVPAYPNAWVRLKRVGQLLSAYWSSNGVDWVQEALTDWSTNATGPMPASVYVGICCTAHNNDPASAVVPTLYYTASFANYNSAFVAPTNSSPATVKASISGSNISISWTPTGGTLQSSPTVGPGATWTPVGTANPATVPISGSTKFFRVGP